MKQIFLNTTELKKVIGFTPMPCQQEILNNLKRTDVIVGGRRCGKSYLISYLALRELLTAANKEIWIVGPIYNLAKIIWNNLVFWINQNFQSIFKINISDMTITNTFNGSKLTLKSADNLASLKGQGLDLLLIDEAGMIDEEIFTRYLRANISESRPALKGERGRLIVTGNAASLGSWFHRLWQNESPDQFSYHWPIAKENNQGEIIATNNYLVEIEELKQIKKTTPSFIWEAEYMANWLSPEASLFKNIRENIMNDISSVPKIGRFYYIGVDLAKKEDFSVITVIDSANFEVVYWDRFNLIEWPYQRSKIIQVAKTYNNAKVLIDSTGLGQVVLDELMRAEIYVEGFNFTSESKKQILEKLALYVETGKIKYPPVDELIKELEVFGFEVSPKTGRLTYGVPSGYHSDCVISLALAVWGLPEFPILPPTGKRSPQELLKIIVARENEEMMSRDKKDKYPIIRPVI